MRSGAHNQDDKNPDSGVGQLQFSASTPEWMLFSFGAHNCPGRFFAANEIKIAMCHLMLKYDWRLCSRPGAGRQAVEEEEWERMDTGVKIGKDYELQYRRRKEEIDLDWPGSFGKVR